MTEDLLDRYCNGLIRLLEQWGGKFNRPIDTIYLGGGTPSLLEHRLIPILKAINSYFNVLPNPEITLELNPSGNSEKMLDFAIRSGINRLSIGAQSGNNDELKILGRTHTAEDTVNTFNSARKLGFSNISLDLMLGLPDSDCNSLKQSLEFICQLSPEHISAYLLKIEEKTFFYKNADKLNLPDDDEQAKQYLLMCDFFEKAGYNHYEISNFCKGDKISRHNIKYWLGDDYLGLGPAAHSFVDGKRFYFPRNTAKFLECSPPVEDGEGGGKEEYIMLRLRLKTGIIIKEYTEKFSEELPNEFLKYCHHLQKADYLIIDNEHIRLTNKGMLLSNSIITELLDFLD